jgi:hypothetical protein
VSVLQDAEGGQRIDGVLSALSRQVVALRNRVSSYVGPSDKVSRQLLGGSPFSGLLDRFSKFILESHQPLHLLLGLCRGRSHALREKCDPTIPIAIGTQL